MKRFLPFLMCLSACGESTAPDSPFADLALDADSLRMQIGRSQRLHATLPDDSTALDGAVILWSSTSPDVATVDASGRVSAVGLGTTTVTATVEGVAVSAHVEAGLAFLEITVGRAHACGIVPNGEIWCWGDGTSGQLGNDGREVRRQPVRVQSDLAFVQVSAGWDHTCAVAADASAWCWGRGGLRQRGDGSTDDVAETPRRVINGFEWRQLSAGVDHTCGVTVDDEVSCWGGNTSGQLGIGTFGPRFGPAPIPGVPPMRSVSAGAAHTCAVSTADELWCWGANDFGQLATDTTPTSPRPAPTRAATELAVRSVSTGRREFTCAVTTTGTAWCWGRGDDGQLGIGATPENVPAPAAVTGDIMFAAVNPGMFHTCGTALDGTAWCWGMSRLGLPGVFDSPAPVALPAPSQFARIQAGMLHTCGVTADWTAWCWGGNGAGELGNGDTQPSDVPVQVALQP